MIAALLLVSQALAVNVKFCFEFDIGYDDFGRGEDFWDSAADQAASGVWYEIYSNTSGSVLDDGYLADSGSEDGCVTVALTTGQTYRVSAMSKAEVNGMPIYSYDDDTSPALATDVFYMAYLAPALPTTKNMDIPFTDARFKVLGVATWAMERAQPSGIDGNLNLYGDDGNWADEDGVHIQSPSRKYVIGHEIGHWVGAKRDEHRTPDKSYDADEDGCDGDDKDQDEHGQVVKEFQSAAASEGWADYYSAVLSNDTSASECVYIRHYPSDFDLDGDTDNSTYEDLSCEDIPVTGLPSYVTAEDWLEDLVNADDDDTDSIQCQGTLINRGTHHDWLRFFWDLTTDQGVSFEEVVDVYDDMNPWTFDPDGSTFTNVDDPRVRLALSCLAHGITAECGAEDQNGQDR